MGILLWHYSEGLKKFFGVWRNYLEFFWHLFMVGRHFLSLFSPWKRDITNVGLKGFHPLLLARSFLENIFTRVVGAIVRTFVIIAGLLTEVLAFIGGVALLAVWLTLPAALVLIPLAFAWLGQLNIFGLMLLAGYVLANFFLFIISIRAYRNRHKDYALMTFAELAEQAWFERVWKRLGVTGKDVDLSILSDKERLDEYLRTLDLTPEEFDRIVYWEIDSRLELEKRMNFWSRESLLSTLPIGRHWRFAYTNHLDRYSDDLSVSDFSDYGKAQLVAAGDELEELKRVLARPLQNNAILVGEFGVGKNTIIHTFAKEIRESRSLSVFANKRVLKVGIKEIISDRAASGDADQVLIRLFNEAAYAGNIILVMEDMHEYLDQAGSFGKDISPVLSDFLAMPTFQIIGTSLPGEFHAKVENKGNIMKYCEKILVPEMDKEEAMRTVFYKLRETERQQVIFSYQGLRELVELADRYIADVPFPEKALDLMEEVIIHWNNKGGSSLITREIVSAAVSSKIKVPLGEIGQDEGDKLLNLEALLHERVISQHQAIKQIAETMRRARIGMASKNRPIGSFLFLGPTGVGKTESAKALAEAYFGSADRMIRLDMSEYQNASSIDRLLGSSAGRTEGHLVSKVKETPYALLLLDEIEKAYPEILNLFLQVLDEGHLTDAFGHKISFRNLIIIATSNAGAEIIKDGIAAGLASEDIKKQVTDHVIRSGIFRPEFLNRFEDVIFFHPLTADDIRQVTLLVLGRYARKLRKQNNIDIVFEADVPDAVAQAAYDPVFGARAIDRYVQDKVGDKIARKIIEKSLKKGEKLTFSAADLEG